VDGIGALADRKNSSADRSAAYRETAAGFIHGIRSRHFESKLVAVCMATGGNERDLIPFGRELTQMLRCLARVAKFWENGMPRFFRRLARGISDLEDLKYPSRTNWADFVAAAAQHYGFAADNVVAVGYSNGANIAASMLLLRPEILSAAILFRRWCR